MTLVVYSKSCSYSSHIDAVVGGDISHRSNLSTAVAVAGKIYLVYASSFGKELHGWLEAACQKGVVVAVAAENPQVEDLLAYTEIGVQGYFNAYMSAPNYDQMLRLLGNGQSFYPPSLLTQAFDLARSVIRRSLTSDPLEKLTKREREVALLVSEGKSNKLVANECNMSERTVKTHLTHIFKKLQVKDRVALVIHLNQFGPLKIDQSITS